MVAAAWLSACGSSPGSSAGPAPTAAPTDNGESAKTARQALDDGIAALRGAHSLTVRGSVTGGGSTVSVDVTVAGGSSRGTVTADGTAIEFVAVAGVYYIRSPALVGKLGGPAIATRVDGHFIRVPPGTPGADQIVGGIRTFADAGTLADEVARGVTGTPAPNGRSSIGGAPVAEIDDSVAAYFVAATGPPRLLRVSQHLNGTLDFGGYDARPAITAPADAIDLNTLTSPSPGPTP